MTYFMQATYPRRFTAITRSHSSKSMSTTSVSARTAPMSAPTLKMASTPLGGGRPDAGGRAGHDDDLSGQAAQSHGHLPSLSGTI